MLDTIILQIFKIIFIFSTSKKTNLSPLYRTPHAIKVHTAVVPAIKKQNAVQGQLEPKFFDFKVLL